MRLDRFITLDLVHPFRQALVTRHPLLVTSLPILMYHSISDDLEPGVRPYYRVCTGSQRFREQLQWLKDNGYQGVTLSAGLAWLDSAIRKQKTKNRNPKSEIGNHHCPPPAFETRPVVLTFDDGFHNFYTHAFPTLQDHGFSATMYLPTAFIGNNRRSFKSRECLTWAESSELQRAGIEFGSHTTNHPQLLELQWSEVEHEIKDSKFEIEAQLGVPCATFAYPYAFPQTHQNFAGRFKDLLKEAGFETCVTTQIGRHHPGADPMEIKRLPVNSGDDVQLLLAKLDGGYDWLALPQFVSKSVRHHFSIRHRSAQKVNGRDQ
jgi:peptidoglycan/xylan/chitin deacetylase (PgdA/CDA1 family)